MLQAKTIFLRPVRAGDLSRLIELCARHAAYEGAEFDAKGKPQALASHLLNGSDKIGCVVLEDVGELVGYASWSREFSTWKAADYVHLDCLYLRSAYRGKGYGRTLMVHIARETRNMACDEMQWQTPSANEGAIGFYQRLGAQAKDKKRYVLSADRLDALALQPGPYKVSDVNALDVEKAYMTCERLGEFAGAWASRDLPLLASFISDDCVYRASVGPGPGQSFVGRDAVLSGFEEMLRHDHKGVSKLRDVFVEGTRGVLKWSYVWRGNGGETIAIDGCDLFTFRGNLIVEKDAYRKTFA